MKTITIILLTAAIVVVGAGGFVQIQALQQRVSILEKALVKNTQQQARTLELISGATDRTTQKQTLPEPPAADKPKAEPAENTAPAALSYLDQLLEM